jgi:hypothetical protein
MTMLDAASSAATERRASASLGGAVSTATLGSCEYRRVTVNSRAMGAKLTLPCLAGRDLADTVRSCMCCVKACILWDCFDGEGRYCRSTIQRSKVTTRSSQHSGSLTFVSTSYSSLQGQHVRLVGTPHACKIMARSRRVEIRFTLVQSTPDSQELDLSVTNNTVKHENSAAQLRPQAAANRKTPTLAPTTWVPRGNHREGFQTTLTVCARLLCTCIAQDTKSTHGTLQPDCAQSHVHTMRMHRNSSSRIM